MSNFNFQQFLSSPIILGVGGFILLSIFVICGWAIFSWIKGGRGKFAKAQTRYQKCIALTAGFKVAFFNLKVKGGYVYNEITNTWHMLDPDALIPNLTTGEFYLPIDERDAIPLFPLKPEIRQAKVEALSKNIDTMALESALEVIHRRQLEKKKEEEAAQRNFALAAAFGILVILVIAIVISKLA